MARDCLLGAEKGVQCHLAPFRGMKSADRIARGRRDGHPGAIVRDALPGGPRGARGGRRTRPTDGPDGIGARARNPLRGKGVNVCGLPVPLTQQIDTAVPALPRLVSAQLLSPAPALQSRESTVQCRVCSHNESPRACLHRRRAASGLGRGSFTPHPPARSLSAPECDPVMSAASLPLQSRLAKPKGN